MSEDSFDIDVSDVDYKSAVWWAEQLPFIAKQRTAPAPEPWLRSQTELRYDVPLIPQPTKVTCWLGAMAMVLSFHKRQVISPAAVWKAIPKHWANYLPYPERTEEGLVIRSVNSRQESVPNVLGPAVESLGFRELLVPSSTSLLYPASVWENWLRTYGPLWISIVGDLAHAVVLGGIFGDVRPTEQSTAAYVEVLNPWDTFTRFTDDPVEFKPPNRGLRYLMSVEDLNTVFGGLGYTMQYRILYYPPELPLSLGLDG